MHTNVLSGPLLTDLYQLTMAYAYWKSGRHEVPASFDLFFRCCPFGGEFAIFAGLSGVISLLEDFNFAGDRIETVREVLPRCDRGFYRWLESLDASQMTVEAVPEGSVVFPRIPLITVTGPLAIGQLLETPLLNLVNFATLVATNAARFRLAAGPEKALLEFGLRRAQGPDGAMSASKYASIGGFNGTSNVLASVLYGIPCKGTHAHAYVQSFASMEDLAHTADAPFVRQVIRWRERLAAAEMIPLASTNEGELAAFISYARAFPEGFLALVDTYDTLRSGVPNFLAVALALNDIGHMPVGVRLDSGDLAYLSKETRKMFRAVSERYSVRFQNLTIVASNDINEQVLHQLQREGHDIDVFGIGTHLVTCQAQPALGGVYKLVEIGGKPRVKRSEEWRKITIPGRKRVYRLSGAAGSPLIDLLTLREENEPQAGQPVRCWHPFDAMKRTVLEPQKVELLQQRVWPSLSGSLCWHSLHLARDRAADSVARMREDHLRPTNPTPYKVSVSPALYETLHRSLAEEAGGSPG